MILEPAFLSIDHYWNEQDSMEFWQPYISHICFQHDIRIEKIFVGIPGTNVVFVINDTYVIKIYTPFSDGPTSAKLEPEIYRLMELYYPAVNHLISIPKILFSGQLFEKSKNWVWPYIILGWIPGTTYKSVACNITIDEKNIILRTLAQSLKLFSSIPFSEIEVFQELERSFSYELRERYFSCQERHFLWNTMSPSMIKEIPQYILSPNMFTFFVDDSACIVHGDLTGDHLIGELKNGKWSPNGIIDFGDVKVTTHMYEIIALHLDMFECNKQLLRIFLEVYKPEYLSLADFPKRMMILTLLHEFNILKRVYVKFPQAIHITNLDFFADLLWNVHKTDSIQNYQ